MIKMLACCLITLYPFASFATEDCRGAAAQCALQLTSTGAIVERATGKVLVQNIGNQGMLADVSLLKFNDQYVLARESSTNDKSTLFIPLKMENNSLVYDSAYDFSISLINSSDDLGVRWSGVKAKIAWHAIDSGVWDRSYGETSKIYSTKEWLSKWPSPWVNISATDKVRRTERCFIPFDNKESSLPVDLIACGAIDRYLTDGHYSLSGVIGARSYVSVDFDVAGHLIDGRYFYTKERKNIVLRGEVGGDGRIQVKEYAGSTGVLTGTFDGHVKNGIISGTWVSADKKKSLPFTLVPQGFPD